MGLALIDWNPRVGIKGLMCILLPRALAFRISGRSSCIRKNHIHNFTDLQSRKKHLRRDLRFYLKHIPSKVAIIHDNLFVEVLRPYTTTDTDNVEHRVVYSIAKPVPLLAVQDNENNERSIISCGSCPASMTSMESSDMLKNSLASSFAHRSREHSFSSGDFGSTSKQEKSGQKASCNFKLVQNHIVFIFDS
ncbi:hypothetical protein CsSME_00014687 [Camellia sinensis var. sinensis]